MIMQNTIIKDYTIKNELGQGGMATVYLAEHNLLGNKSAFKLLNKEFLNNDNIRKRFLSEARNMARMSHPGIIKVTDLIDEGDIVAFVMEYIEGETLKEYIERKGKISDDEIKTIFSQMLDAVGYVHEQNLVHRDIKPSNFMVSPNGNVKLMDFGIAKNTDINSAEYTQTGTGVQMGTPMYMSPEQITETKSVTPQSDIYSLGVVLWQMVTGEKPYDMKTLSTFHLQNKIVNEALPQTKTSFDQIIKIATNKEIDKRFQNTSKFKNALISDEKTIEAPFNDEKTIVESAEKSNKVEEPIKQETTSPKVELPRNDVEDSKAAISIEEVGQKRLKLITKIQIFSFFLLLVAELFFWGTLAGLLYLIILPLNLILLATQFKKLLKIGKSKLEIILNLCSSPFIILMIIFWNKYFWQTSPNPIIYNFLSIFGRFGIYLIVLSEFIFGIRTLLKANKISNLK
jgi:serine/threonine protein kinase